MVAENQADPTGWVTPPLDVEECVRCAVVEAATSGASWARAFGVRFDIAELLDMSGGPLERAVRACAAFVAMDDCGGDDARSACVSISYIRSFPFGKSQMTGEITTRHAGDAVELATVKASVLLDDIRSVVYRRRVARLGRDPSGRKSPRGATPWGAWGRSGGIPISVGPS